MKKLILLAATIAISSLASADEMTSILVQGTKTICSNDNKPVAMNSNLQVSVPDSVLQGTTLAARKLNGSKYSLNRDVKVKIGARSCTLPKWDGKNGGTVLEKVVIKIFCSEKSILVGRLSNGEPVDEDLYADGERTLCGGDGFMFKRIASSDLELENDKYVVDGEKNLYLSDSPNIFTGIMEPKTKLTYFVSEETKYLVPYVIGSYVPSDGTAKT